MFTDEGPYGSLSSGKKVPRWTFNGTGGKVKKVEGWQLGPLTNRTTPVALVNDVHHAISCTPQEDTILEEDELDDYHGTGEIDIEADADHIARTESRLIVRPTLNKLRERTKKDELDPENLVDVPEQELTDTLDAIDDTAEKYRKALLRGAVARMMAFDMASGQTEAIVRDCFETDIQIDDELLPYLECIGNVDIIAATLKDSPNIPQAVWQDALREYLTASLNEIRIDWNKQSKREEAVKRFRSEYDNMVARVDSRTRSVGMARSLSPNTRSAPAHDPLHG